MMKKRVLSLLLCIAMVVGLFPINSLAAITQHEKSVFSDMPDDWSTEALQNALSNGLLKGSEDKIMPDDNLTRAQMAAVIARAFGSTVKGDISAFPDVNSSDWFAEDMAKAYQMGVIKGADGCMNPNSAITRQEVFVILARALKLAPAESMSKTFSDTSNINEWAKGEVYALVNAGYIQGSEGKLNPTAHITRAQFAQVLNNTIKQYIKEAGEVFSVVSGNVMINTPGVILKNLTVNGDLIIGDGVGDGEITLDNVKVTGRMVVRGGGENSVIIKGTSSVSHVVVARVDGKVSVKVEGDADVEVIYIDDGSDDVNIVGNVGTIDVSAPNIKVTVAENSTVGTIKIQTDAANVALEVSGTVSTVTTSASGTEVTGNGTVTKVEAQNGANGATIQTAKTEITVAAGVIGVKGGGGAAIDGGSTKTNNDNGTGVTQAAPASGGSTGGSSGGSASVAVTGITVTGASVQVGSNHQMAVSVSPANATNKALTWSVTNGTGSATISASGLLSAASVGTVTVTATATDGSGVSNSATVTITAVPDANLTGLVLSGTPNDFTFLPTTYDYNGVYVAHDKSSITVTPTLDGASITVNGTAVASGSASGAIALPAAAEQIITVAVTKTGYTSKTYTIHITRIPVWTQGSTISDITLEPSGSITYGPDSGTYTINGNLTIQGSALGTITLQNIRVTGNLTVNTPNATITVQPTVTIEGSTNIVDVADDTFNSQGQHNSGIGVLGGGRLVLGGTAGTVPIIILTTQPIILQGNILFVQVPPSQTGAQLTLGGTVGTLFAQGSGATITQGSGGSLGGVIIPAGGSSPTFDDWSGGTPTVTEAADNLTGLTISAGTLSPDFSGDTYLYNTTVANGVDTITVTPVSGTGTATVKVGGGEQVGGVVPLNVGHNTIIIEVTQAGRTMITYTLFVTRQAAPPATPTITPASGAVAFGTELTMASASADYIFYTTDGSDPLGGVSGSTKAYNPNAKPVINSGMTVKAIAVKAGSPNSEIASASYTQAATADLTGLALSGTPSNYTFSGSTYTYNSVTVGNEVTSITVTPTGSGVIKVDNIVVASGSASSPILLMTPGDEKTITVVVTETGKTPKTYAISIARELNGDATVGSSASHYTVNNTLNTIAANETFINTTTTVGAFLGNLTKNATAQWKVLPSTASIADADDFNGASAKATTAALETGDQLAVMAQNGSIKVYAITVTGLISSTLDAIIPEQNGIVISLFKTVETVDSVVSGLIKGDFLLIKDFGLPGSQEITGTSLYKDPLGGTFEYEILPPSGQTFAAGNYRLAFIKDGYQNAHVDFAIPNAADNTDIAAAQGAIEGASYTATQIEAGNASSAATKAQALVNALSLSDATATVVPGTYTEAIAGTVGDADGTSGSFTFTVNVSKGLGTTVTTAQQTMTITATPYDNTQDNIDIAAAQGAIEGASYTATQIEAGNAGSALAKAQALVSALSLSGTTATVVPGTFTAVTAGTVADDDGTNGSFTFTVTVSKGLGTPVTTTQQTMTITATPYDPAQDNIDITAAKEAVEMGAPLNAVEGTDTNVVSMAQALVTNGVVVTISSSANSKVGSDGTISYNGSEAVGNVIFAFNKGLGTEQTLTVSVTVPTGNFAPEGTNQTKMAIQNMKFSLDLSTIFTDDRDAPANLTYTVVSDDGAATAALNADGKTLEYTPTATDVDNTVVVTVTATDTETATSAAVTITLNVVGEFAGGSGTSASPWQISTPLHLNNIRNYSGAASVGKYFILVNDIDMTAFLGEGGPEYNEGAGWRPIGGTSSSEGFRGTLLGNDKTISNLYINRPGQTYTGLFSYAYQHTIQNLALINVSISGGGTTGSIAGAAAYGTIQNVAVTGSVSGSGGYVGGVIADNVTGSVLSNVFARVNVVGASYNVGGFTGRTYGTISNCYAVGTVVGGSSVGGFAGDKTGGTLSSCYYDSTVSSRSDTGKGEPRTTAELLQQDNYSGWDFATVWGINAAENNGYPFLRWQGYTHISNDATLSSLTIGGQDIMTLPGFEVASPAAAGAELSVNDFTDFTGITATSSDTGAAVVVTLNGSAVGLGDLAAQPVAQNDVIVIAVTAQNGTAKKYYKVTAILAVADTEITGYDTLASVDAGTAGSATYTSAAEVITYLGTNRSTVTISGTAHTVPLTDWTNTDGYDPAVAGSYTFTATIGTLPGGYVDAVDTISTVTLEVVVSALSAANLTSLTENLTANFDPVFAGGTYTYSLAASSNEQGVGLTATLEGATITFSYLGETGKVVASGTIESIPLVVGTNTITIQVSKAGLSTVTYTLSVTKAAPFTAGTGTLGAYSEFTPTANTFAGLYISKNDRESDLFGGIRSVVDIDFPAPSTLGATSYTLQRSTDGGSTWSNFQYGELDLTTESSVQDNFSLNISGAYKFRLLASGGIKDGYVSNVIDVTTAATPTSTEDTRFAGWSLDESMTITGTMAPWVGRGLEASFSAVTVPGDATVSDGLTYQWYRVNPETYEMTPIAGANTATYTTTLADVGYRIMIRATGDGDGVNANGFIQVISDWDILEPNRAYLSDISATDFTLNLFKPAALTEDDLELTDGSSNPVAFTVTQLNPYTYKITADIVSIDYSFRLVNNSDFWRVAEDMMPGHMMEGIGVNLSPATPPSNDATLASATVKSVAANLGTQSDNINAISGGTVTITSVQAANASLSTVFSATAGNASVKAVKYAQGATDFSGFDAAAYNNEAVSNGDFFIIRVTAEDAATVSYYKINVTVTETVTALTGADVSISSGSVIFGYTFQDASGSVTYGEALNAPYYLNTNTSTVTLTDGTDSVNVNLSNLDISAAGTVTYENIAAIQAAFVGLDFIPSQIQLHLVGATTVNGGTDNWEYNVTVTLDPAEIALLTPDSTPPIVTAAAQTVTNEAGHTVTARSSESGTVFIILDGEAHATQADIQAALAAFKASAKETAMPDTDVSISSTGLTGGTYHAYAVDAYGNISAAGANAITITQVITPGGGADKSVLNTALGNAGANKLSVTVSADGTNVYAVSQWVTTATMTAYESAISAAQDVADNGLATQQQVDDAVSALAAATVTFNSVKQQGTKLCVTSVTLRNVTDAVTATPGAPLAANIGDELEITAVTVSDGESAAGRVEYFVAVLEPTTMANLGTININATLNSFIIPQTYTHVDTTQHSIEGKLIHFGARLLTDSNSGVAAAAGPLEVAAASGISGVVRDKLGNPIEGVYVGFCGGLNTTTNVSGEYTLSTTSGSYYLELFHDYYYHSTTPVEVTAPTVYEATMQDGGKITGKIILEGALPDGRTITAQISEYNNLDKAPVSETSFTVRGVPVGTKTLSFYLTGGTMYESVYISPTLTDHTLAAGVTLNSFADGASTISVPVTHPDGASDDGIIDIGTVKLIYLSE